MAGLVLVIDDDPVQRRLIEAALTKFGHECLLADGGVAAFEFLDGPRGQDVSAIILDLVMPGMSGMDVLAELRQRKVEAPVIVQTSQGSIDAVVAAMRAGAFDFVVKPVSPDRIHQAITKALKVESREEEKRRRIRKKSDVLGFDDLKTRSAKMQHLFRLGRKAASSNIPILIEGESGVGKEVLAQAIQREGNRRDKPFVTVNCGAIPDNLVESILFGHERGSFTGASEKHAGKFLEANGGTLFLDEVGDLPLDVQVKLLRAVQTGEIDPVGSRQTIKVDIRLISATHRDLAKRVRDGLFREDLFYRLSVFPISVPRLYERREDIAGLVSHFIEQMSQSETDGRVQLIDERALAMLEAYDWPGNIRQLENAVFRALVLSEGTSLGVDDFPQIRTQLQEFASQKLSARDVIRSGEFHRTNAHDPSVSVRFGASAAGVANVAHPGVKTAAALGQSVEGDRDHLAFGHEPAPEQDNHMAGLLRIHDDFGEMRSLADVELEMISRALEHYQGQMSEVARRLGIGRSTLYRKLKEYGIEPDDVKETRLVF